MTKELNQDLVSIFATTANQKLGHLDSILSYAMGNGFHPPALAGIQRTLNSLRSIAQTFEQPWLAEIVEKEFLKPLHKILSDSRSPTQTELAELEDVLFGCRSRIQSVLMDTFKDAPQAFLLTDPVDTGKSTILSALGQVSIWNTHEMSGQLAKLHAFNEMTEDWLRDLGKTTHGEDLRVPIDELRDILKRSQQVLTNISETLRRTRAARGRLKPNRQVYEARQFLKQLTDNESSRREALWEVGEIPEVQFILDKSQFEFIWLSLNKLLMDWLAPEANFKVRCEFEKAPDSKHARLAVVVEPRNEKSAPFEFSKCTLGSVTPYQDTGNVFSVSRRLAKAWSIEVLVGLTQQGFPCLCYTLPCCSTDKPASSETLHAPEKSASSPSKPAILVVDDDEDLNILLKRKLKRLGYRTLSANTVDTAKTVMKTENVALTLVDLFLGKESGLELLSSIRQENPGVRVILISGAQEDDVSSGLLRALISHADAFLRKPIDDELFKATMEKFYPR